MNKEIYEKYEPVIGLEIHAQLLTESKAFSSSSTKFGASPNTNTDPVTLAHPGTLPVLNRKVVDYAIMMGLATNCNIRERNLFARKNYFYQDLPKGYQISQDNTPICYDGHLVIELDEVNTKHIGITRIHMEEDSGKSIHDLDIDTLVDFNRAGVALIEIVTEPDIRSSAEAYLYLTQIKQILVYLGINTGNMEEGALRVDANVSVRPKGREKFGTRTEVKNLNSFRNVEKAIDYEIKRQIELIEQGGEVRQVTMQWDGNANQTKEMRTKEMSHDYRYFPEPDLPPLIVKEDWVEKVRAMMPELPLARKNRFIEQYEIPNYDAGVIVAEKEIADFYEEAISKLENKNAGNNKLVSNWVMTEIMRMIQDRDTQITDLNVKPIHIAEIVDLVSSGTISNTIAKDIFADVELGKSPKEIVEEKGLKQVSDTSFIDDLVKGVIEANPDSVEKFKSGNAKVKGFFVGQVMKESKGKANPQIVSDLVDKYLQDA
ncbi:MAG: Asp-tRNA(Asn)/Glu-tRNA(Gln) amidotransferase GatCAB subunit B [Ignavibacteriae bacterium HGW-Ignavibacteriae-4]|jgi:aspartyl-tRNA(Asn)/glutamyl-tRNA(Gln) amidotransferase subunit B|nr:MAG: Asp-tRNA(Asn)/Glu-tRNA(Gln) amidotransferase GatCAB subunit B [Ignavibacteriae bacterium HGW-Ignavibacteriae-4]